MWRRRNGGTGARLADECEVFLRGLYAEYLVEVAQPVPGWAWANALAHGDETRLRDVARRPAAPGWGEARRFLAGEVLGLAASGPLGLAELQRAVLVPLELELAALPGPQHWGPGQLVAVVLVALRERIARPRP